MNDNLQRQLINDLLLESHEGLDHFDKELLNLEQGQSDEETMNTIFRVIHTLKGTAGCLGFGHIEKTAHAGENVLSQLRDGNLSVTGEMITVLLTLSDRLRAMLRALESTGNDFDADNSELLEQLEQLQRDEDVSAAEGAAENEAFGLFDEEDELAGSTPPDASAETPATADIARDVPAPAASVSAASTTSGSEPSVTKGSVTDSAIRVDVGHLDKVMNLVGELVLARNQIVANTTQFDMAALLTASQRLNLITTELQESVMKTRMQPIGNVFGKFPRVVRDIAHELGKKVRLVIDGQSTELDRTIIEAIKDPLTHVIRNSIDHGIEDPGVRRASNKSEEGMLCLRAFHEGGQVNIEVMDDGAGIDVERVKAKAVAQNRISSEQAARLNEREALNLIFLPGLSTAQTISNVSGRGVGMDVVKTNIEKIGGSIELHTERGQGTTLRIKIPLTLAIIPALIVTSGGARYAIPQVSLLELVRLEGEQIRNGIEELYGAPVYRLRGQLLPLIYLNAQFGVASKKGDSEVPCEDEVVSIVVLQADGRNFGIVVDEINDTEEIVVKPLGKQLKGLKCFAGATIMGDGRVALILDVVGLAQDANVVSEGRERSSVSEKDTADRDAENRRTLLLFDVGEDRRMAIPLAQAARLEEIPSSTIERTGSQEVVQYRGQILPLIRVVDHVAGGQAGSAPLADTLQVVVYTENGRSVGLIVSRISDIVDEAITVERNVSARGILGTVVVQGRVTDLLDVPALIRAVDPGFYQSAA